MGLCGLSGSLLAHRTGRTYAPSFSGPECFDASRAESGFLCCIPNVKELMAAKRERLRLAAREGCGANSTAATLVRADGSARSPSPAAEGRRWAPGCGRLIT